MNLLQKVVVYVLFTVLLGVACSCGSMTGRKQFEGFTKRTRDYGTLLRWGQYSDAALMRRSVTGELAGVDVAPLKEIRVTSYRVTGTEFAPEQHRGIVKVSIDFYHERENRLRTIQDQQMWWYDPETENWYMEGDLPAFLTQ